MAKSPFDRGNSRPAPPLGWIVLGLISVFLIVFCFARFTRSAKKTVDVDQVVSRADFEKTTTEVIHAAAPRSNVAVRLEEKPRVEILTAPPKTNSRIKIASPSIKPPRIPIVPPLIDTNATIFPRPVQNILEAQIALSRLSLSPGSIDGLIGAQTKSALRAFQGMRGLPVTGILDPLTRSNLVLETPPLRHFIVADPSGFQTIPPTWLEKSQLPTLGYESLLEMLSEMSAAHPSLLRKLNPAMNWTNIAPGTSVTLLSVERAPPPGKAALIKIKLAEKTLEAFDSDSHVLLHFPCSIAQKVEKRPVGELHVAVLAPNPNYTFDPEIFPESPEARELKQKLIIPPGPNNPVGTAWIGLDRTGYGIHGTPRPEEVGRTESHGCFRLANWNAEQLMKIVWIGLPVVVEP